MLALSCCFRIRICSYLCYPIKFCFWVICIQPTRPVPSSIERGSDFLQTGTMLSSCFLVFLSVSPVIGYVCEKTAQICETSLDIEHYLTMSSHDSLAVYPKEGKLYKYDVTNTSNADPVPKENIITGDGWEMRRLLVVANQSLPGPDIIVYEGQTVIIHVKNHLHSDTVTIHWHGLHQSGTPFMDGVPFVSQCPIESGQTFTYKFKAYPPGTFWYHSHVGSQRVDGLLGAFVTVASIVFSKPNPASSTGGGAFISI
uniref:Laccase-1 n=1 Tax=Magallana gigas TaxID=29159 RepID=K1Q1L5_MAGGI